jgi:predicted metal-dependent phosphoesterase TrpH
LEVYETLKSAGLDLVTITDHDSIGASEDLGAFPDFFASEEVTVQMPSGTEAHITVYDLTEGQHFEIQSRRDDLPSLIAYRHEQNLLFGVNHVFSSLTGRRDLSDFDWFERHFPVWEARNGATLACANQSAADFSSLLGKAITAGSDSHTMRSLACTYTVVPGARCRDEFLAGLRSGNGRAAGVPGNHARVTMDVLEIAMRLIRRQPWTVLLAPFLLGVPVATFLNCVREERFTREWTSRLERSRCAPDPEGAKEPVAT